MLERTIQSTDTMEDEDMAMVVRARSPSVSSVDSAGSSATSCTSWGHHPHHSHRPRRSALGLPGRPRRPPRLAPRESSGLVARAVGLCATVTSIGLLHVYLLAVLVFQRLWRAWR